MIKMSKIEKIRTMPKKHKAIVIIAVFAIAIFGAFKIFDDRGFNDVVEECNRNNSAVIDGRSLVIEGQLTWYCAKKHIDVPERINAMIARTSSLDGWQEDSFSGLKIGWSYSGFKGLDVILTR